MTALVIVESSQPFAEKLDQKRKINNQSIADIGILCWIGIIFALILGGIIRLAVHEVETLDIIVGLLCLVFLVMGFIFMGIAVATSGGGAIMTALIIVESSQDIWSKYHCRDCVLLLEKNPESNEAKCADRFIPVKYSPEQSAYMDTYKSNCADGCPSFKINKSRLEAYL